MAFSSREKPCSSGRAETREIGRNVPRFFFGLWLFRFCTFFGVIFFKHVFFTGVRRQSRWEARVARPRPSLICGPLECGLLSVQYFLFKFGDRGGRKTENFLKHKGLGHFPREAVASKVPVGRGLLKDGVLQVQVLDDLAGPQVKVLPHDFSELGGAFARGAVVHHGHGEGLRNANGIGNLDKAPNDKKSFISFLLFPVNP